MTQRLLAKLLGISDVSISQSLRGRRLRGVPRYLKAVVCAWEIMTPAQRHAWVAAMEAEPPKRSPGDRAGNKKAPPAGAEGAGHLAVDEPPEETDND